MMEAEEVLNSFGEKTMLIDRLLDKELVAFLSSEPLIGAVYSEESGWAEFGKKPLTAIVDPLDGSRNYSMGLSYYAAAVALIDDRRRCRGSIVTNLVTGKTFSAIRGEGAFADSSPIYASDPPSLGDVDAIFVGLSRDPDELRALADLAQSLRSFRAMGSAALDLCCLAAGNCGLFVDLSGTAKIIDILASSLIVEEAHGQVLSSCGIPVCQLLASRDEPLHLAIRRSRPRVLGVGGLGVVDEALPKLAAYFTAESWPRRRREHR